MAKLSGITTPSLTFDEGAAPSTPSASDVIVYAKADGLMYSKDDAGTETLMSSGAGGGAGHGVRATRTTTQAITTASFTAIAFNATDVFDTDAYHDTSTNNSRITIPTGLGGLYVLTARCTFAAHATGQRQIAIRLGGSTYIVQDSRITLGAGGSQHITCTTIYDLDAAQYVEAMVYQDSGGDLNVDSNAQFSAVLIGAGS